MTSEASERSSTTHPNTLAREAALQCLYALEQGAGDVEELLEQLRTEKEYPASVLNRAARLVEGCRASRGPLDELIARHAANWTIDRMPIVDRNILRLGLHEMLHEADVPAIVSIDEAVRLAHKYGSEESCSFVNAILDRIRATREGGE